MAEHLATLRVSDDELPYGAGTLAEAGSEEEWERRRAAFSMGHTEYRRAEQLRLGDLVWHPSTLLYRPLLEVRYSFDGRWELRLRGGHSCWLPNRNDHQHPDEVIVLVDAGSEYLRRSNNGLGAD